jgi:hypothetical protein
VGLSPKVEMWPVERCLSLRSVDSDPRNAFRDYYDADPELADECSDTWDPNLEGADMMNQVLHWKRYDESYRELIESMRTNGVTSPIGVNGNELANGHHRLAAMIDLGYTEIPVVTNEVSSDPWLITEYWGRYGGDKQLLPPPGA